MPGTREAQVEDCPFPWPVKGQEDSHAMATEKICTCPTPLRKSVVSWQSHVGDTMRSPDVCSLLEEIEEHDKISLWLPIKATTAGVVLQHSLQVVATIFERWYPLVFKFGFTSNPVLRWENRKYGYRWERDKWERMEILFVSNEPWSPAMLEACLIDRYEGALQAFSVRSW